MKQIKKEYLGLTITKNIYNIGSVTLNTDTITSDSYDNYIKIGFSEIFEEGTSVTEVESLPVIKYTGIVNKKPVIKKVVKKKVVKKK